MKARIKIPKEHWKTSYWDDREQHFIDEVLLWGMEIDIQIEHYATTVNQLDNRRVAEKVATFIVEEKDAFLFVLKWGALMKSKPKRVENV